MKSTLLLVIVAILACLPLASCRHLARDGAGGGLLDGDVPPAQLSRSLTWSRSLSETPLRVRGGGLGGNSSSSSTHQATPSVPNQVIVATTTSKSKDAVGATIANEVFNLVKAIVGVGVLSLPSGIAAFADAPSAVVPALVLIASIGLLSAYGFAVLGKVCAYTGTSSYRQAWSASVGLETAWIPAWSTVLKTLFACTAFSMVLADTFTKLLRLNSSTWRTTVLVTLTLCILLPLCWLPNLSSLAPFSLLGVLGMAYTAVAMTVRWMDGSYGTGGALVEQIPRALRPAFGDQGWQAVASPRSLILVCMLSTAYMAHFNAPKFYLELRNNTLARFNAVVALAFGISILLMGYMTAIGFLTFGKASSGLILNHYAGTDSWMSASRIAVALSLVFSYPLAFQGCRDGLLDLLQLPSEKAVLNTTTVILLSVLTLLAATLNDVGFVLALSGATLGNALTYVYPALMYRAVVHKQNRKEPVGVAIASVSAVLGTVMGAVGAKMAITTLLNVKRLNTRA